jgi:4-amino-4-deoxy-L-arabinose transferase-like glycosyltransferase
MKNLQASAWVKWGLIGLFVAWFFFTVASYFVVYKPFSPLLVAQLAEMTWLPLGNGWAALGRALLDLLEALWLGAMGLGVGLWIWDFLIQTRTEHSQSRRKGAEEDRDRDRDRELERVVFGFGLGFGAVGLLVLLVGVLGWLNTTFLSIFTVVLSAIGVQKLVRLRVGWKRPFRPVAIYIIIVVFMALTLALLPPTSWDGLFYHLKGPKLYLEAGRIVGGIDIPHLSFPSLFQMWYLLAMGIRGDVAAQLIHILFLFALGGMVYTFAREHFGLEDGWTAVLFLYATPMVLTLSTWSYNDLGLAFFSTGSVYAFLKWQKIAHRLTQINTYEGKESASSESFRVQSHNLQWLAVSGVFAGLAMSMKYTSIVGPAALGLLLLWQVRRDWRARRTWSAGVKPVLVFGITAVIVLAPWLIKNALFTGNPVYPFVFDGLYWDEFRAAAYSNAGSGIGFDLIALLRLPYDMMLGIRDASQDGRTGALYLAFLPFILFYAFRKFFNAEEKEEKKREERREKKSVNAVSYVSHWLDSAVNKMMACVGSETRLFARLSVNKKRRVRRFVPPLLKINGSPSKSA